MPLAAPTLGLLVSTAVAPPSATLQWTGVAGADHYDIYRSQSALDVGVKINVNPVPQPAAPFVFTFTDDGVSSTGAPAVAQPFLYRAVAVDIAGNISLPSLAVPVMVQSAAQVLDSVQANIKKALVADATLMGMLVQDVSRIRFHFQKPRMGFQFPFVVFWRLPGKEKQSMKPVRQRTFDYQVYVYDSSPASQVGYNIRERIIQVLENNTVALTDCSVHCFAVMALDLGQDLHEDQVNAWYYPMKLTVIAELQAATHN